MASFIDSELGEVIVHKRRGTRSVRIKLGTDGRLVATAPFYTPLRFIKQVVITSRDELKKLLEPTNQPRLYVDQQTIGKHHTLRVVPTSMVKKPTTRIERHTLLVYIPPATHLEDHAVQQQIRDTAITILRREAKAYLPGALQQLAESYGFSYERVRFSHASGRWGSCSSTGTISLNIALMKLPDELIHYVLIHELAHTRQMNHSKDFWAIVERYDPHFRVHRRQLKRETPSV